MFVVPLEVFLYHPCVDPLPVTTPLPIEGQPVPLVLVDVALKLANNTIVADAAPPEGDLVGDFVFVGVLVLVFVFVGVCVRVLVLLCVIDFVLVGV